MPPLSDLPPYPRSDRTPDPAPRPSRWRVVGIAVSTFVLGVIVGAVVTTGDSSPAPVADTPVPTVANRTVAQQARAERQEEKRAQREQREEQQADQAAQRQQVQAVQRMTETCESQDGEPRPLPEVEGEAVIVVRCEVRPFVALAAWSSDTDRYVWTRWWRIGSVPDRMRSRYFVGSKPARVPTPPPPPAPLAPAAPAPAPAPAAPQGPPGYPYTGNNGYTGPRCYAPGGVWWKPC